MKKEPSGERILTTHSRFWIKQVLAVAVLCVSATPTWAQSAQAPASGTTARTITAIGYPVGGGTITVNLKGTDAIASASGQAKVEAKSGITQVEVRLKGLTPPTPLGAEFLTYVLWAVSPEGRAANLGEILFGSNGEGELKTTTQFATFSLFVTAEPYFAVRQPSEILILENVTPKSDKVKIFPVQNYQLMKRSQYEKLGNPLALSLDLKNVPLEMYEARNSVEIARSRRADEYANGIFSKAEGGLKMAENAQASKKNKKEVISLARQTAQFSEDARAVSVQKQEEERIAKERAEAAAVAKTQAEAKAAAEAAEAKRKSDEESQRQAELAAAKQAQMKAEA